MFVKIETNINLVESEDNQEEDEKSLLDYFDDEGNIIHDWSGV